MPQLANDLYIETTGRRDAAISLVFMHGPGLDHTCFRPFVEALAADYQLIFYDARLCGRSPRTSARTVDLDVLADDLERVAKTATGAVVAVAHSFAPLVALQATRRASTVVHALILVAAGVSNSIGDTLLKYVRANATEAQRLAIERAFTGGITTDVELARAWRTIFPLYVARYTDHLGAAVLDDVRFSAEAFNSFVQHAAGRLDGMAAIAELQMPLLVIGGAHDWIECDPSGGSRALCQANHDADLHMLADSAHFPFAEEPQAFVDAVHHWLARHQQRLTR